MGPFARLILFSLVGGIWAAKAGGQEVSVNVVGALGGPMTARLLCEGGQPLAEKTLESAGRVTLPLLRGQQAQFLVEGREGWCGLAVVEPGPEFTCSLVPWAFVEVRSRPSRESPERRDAPPEIRFSDTPPPDEGVVTLPFEAACRRNGDSSTCRVPEGRRELVVLPGSASPLLAGESDLRAGQVLVVNAPSEAPAALLTASIVGLRSPERMEAAVRYTMSRKNGQAPRQLELQKVSIDASGKLAMRGLAPGRATLSVSSGGSGLTVERAVDLVSGGLVDLGVIELSPPLQLAVQVTPAVPPGDDAWHVELLREEEGEPAGGDGVHYLRVQEGEASPSGSWSATGLRPGAHLVRIADAKGNVWWRDAAVDPSKTTVCFADLAFVPIRGRVLVGGQPVAARLRFGSDPAKPDAPPGNAESSAVRIELASDAEGRFEGALPFEGTWKLAVAVDAEESPEKPTNRDEWTEVGSRQVARERSGAPAFLEVDVPDGRVPGSLVDEQGQGVKGTVEFKGVDAGRLSFRRATRADGTFDIRRVPEGVYLLRGLHFDGRMSDRVRLEVHDGGSTPPQTLVLRPTLELRGEVTLAGAPVPGAVVIVVLPGETDSPRVVTGALGRFDVPVQNEEVGVAVIAPGRPALFARSRVSKAAERIRFELGLERGGLDLDLSRLRLSPEKRLSLNLRANGVEVSLYRVENLLAFFSADRPVIELPSLAPGAYEVCWATNASAPATCEPAVVQAGNRAVVDLGPP